MAEAGASSGAPAGPQLSSLAGVEAGDPDSTLDKIACIEEMINRMEDDGPSPCDVFLRGVLSQVNKEDVYNMVCAQKHMLSRFEKTNEMLLNFNALSRGRFEATHQEFRRHTQLLADTRRDLDAVFRRIRSLKSKMSKQYPQAFRAVAASGVLEEEEDEPPPPSPRPTMRPPRPPQPRSRRPHSGSPSNRHSWAGPPTNTSTPDAAESVESLLDNTPAASTETLRKDSESHQSNSDIREEDYDAKTNARNIITEQAIVHCDDRNYAKQSASNGEIRASSMATNIGKQDSTTPPPTTATIVSGEGDEEDGEETTQK